MRQDLPLGHVAGIRLGVNWTVAVILALITWLLGGSVLPSAAPHEAAAVDWAVAAGAAALFLLSLLAHELSHALVARRNGMTVRAVTLWMLGGITELEGEPPDAGADLRVAVVGPAVSAAAAGLFLGAAVAIEAAGGPTAVTAATTWLALMNGMLAIFNLLPGAPLDGGRVLRAVLWRHYRDRRRADLAAARSGQVLGAGIIGLGLAEVLMWSLPGGVWLILIGWFMATAAGAERRAAIAASVLGGLRVADVMTADPQVAQGWSTIQDFIDHVAAWSRQEAFPVMDFDGTLAGVVITDMLASIPGDTRAALRIDRVALPVPPANRAAPSDPAALLLARRPVGGQVLAVVLTDGRVVGMVTVTDIRQAVRWRRLATAPA